MEGEIVRDDDIQVFYAEGITFKVIIIGDAEVGKTSIVHSHIKKNLIPVIIQQLGLTLQRNHLLGERKKSHC